MLFFFGRNDPAITIRMTFKEPGLVSTKFLCDFVRFIGNLDTISACQDTHTHTHTHNFYRIFELFIEGIGLLVRLTGGCNLVGLDYNLSPYDSLLEILSES